MDIRKVRPGDDISISAETWNALLSLVTSGKQVTNKPTPATPAKSPNSGVVVVRNSTGSAIDQFHSVRVTGPSVTPASSESEFKRRIVLDVATPNADSSGLWCVMQEPVAAGAFGEAVVSGITIARVNITSTEHVVVESSDGSTVLASGGESGSGQLLWVAGGVGSASSTGEQWAIIRLPTGGGGGSTIQPGLYQGQHLTTLASSSIGWQHPQLHEVF